MDSWSIDLLLRRRFRLKSAPTLSAKPISRVPIAFSELRCEDAAHGRAEAVPPENSFAFQVLLKPIRSWAIWHPGRHAVLPPSAAGDIFLFDLSEDPRLELHDPYDAVRFYIPQSALDSLAYEGGLPRIGGLRAPRLGAPDPVLHGMALALSASMARPEEAQTMFVEHMALAFHAHVARAYGGMPEARRLAGGLTPRQLRTIFDIMNAALHAEHSVAALAMACGLSSSHFSQAFKASTGVPPHQWLMRRRIRRAEELLAQTSLGMADIAVACGFADQSHFTRVFRRVERQSPRRWAASRGFGQGRKGKDAD